MYLKVSEAGWVSYFHGYIQFLVAAKPTTLEEASCVLLSLVNRCGGPMGLLHEFMYVGM